MIEIRNLTRMYGDVVAVRDMTTSIGRGEIVGLLGHNGAGKTTAMKMLTGYLEPTSGSVSIGGADPSLDPIAAQRRVGYLPENAPVWPEMNVQEYLVSIARLRGLDADAIPRAVLTAAEDTDLVERLLQPISTLSKGLRQRVGIAQAIVHRPDVLILDEPTNGLDPTQIQTVRALIRRLGEKSTVLLSTHILQEVEAVCSRVLVMIGGRLVADRPIGELTASDKLRISLPSSATEARSVLSAVAEVSEVRELGTDPHRDDYVVYNLDCGGQFPVEAVLDVVRKNNWPVGSIGPEHRTLETAFRELEREHVLNAGGGR